LAQTEVTDLVGNFLVEGDFILQHNEISMIMEDFIYRYLVEHASDKILPMGLTSYLEQLEEQGVFDDMGIDLDQYRDTEGNLNVSVLTQELTDYFNGLFPGGLNEVLKREQAKLMAKFFTHIIRQNSIWVPGEADRVSFSGREKEEKLFGIDSLSTGNFINHIKAVGWKGSEEESFSTTGREVPILTVDNGELVVNRQLTLPSLFPTLLKDSAQAAQMRGLKLVVFHRESDPEGVWKIGAVRPQEWEAFKASNVDDFREIHDITVDYRRYGAADENGEWSELKITIELPRDEYGERTGDFLFITNLQTDEGEIFPGVLLKGEGDQYYLVTGEAPKGFGTDKDGYFVGELAQDGEALSFQGRKNDDKDDDDISLRLVNLPNGPYGPGLVPLEDEIRGLLKTFNDQLDLPPALVRAYSQVGDGASGAMPWVAVARAPGWNSLGLFAPPPEIPVFLYREGGKLFLGTTSHHLPVLSPSSYREPIIVGNPEEGDYLALVDLTSKDVNRSQMTTGIRRLDQRLEVILSSAAEKGAFLSRSHASTFLGVPMKNLILVDRETWLEKFWHSTAKGQALFTVQQAVNALILASPVGGPMKMMLNFGLPVDQVASGSVVIGGVKWLTGVKGAQ